MALVVPRWPLGRRMDGGPDISFPTATVGRVETAPWQKDCKSEAAAGCGRRDSAQAMATLAATAGWPVKSLVEGSHRNPRHGS